MLAHNATYDALGFDHHGHVDAIALLDRTFDTKILAHLKLIPGAVLRVVSGTASKNLSFHHVDKSAPDSDSALKELFKQNKWSVQQGWKNIPAAHPTLVHYAGTDVILTVIFLSCVMRSNDRLWITWLSMSTRFCKNLLRLWNVVVCELMWITLSNLLRV